MALNHTPDTFFSSQAFWGPVTSTLDWCEANYQFSRYIAEAANSFSNVVTVALAVYGAFQCISEGLPSRYLVGYTGFALVGIGSFIFHATLLFEAQLMDELPMVYVASYCVAVLFDTSRGFQLKGSNAPMLAIVFVVFNIFFTWSYYVTRHPVYHQAVFAALMLITTSRTIYLLNHSESAQGIPAVQRKSIGRVFLSGAGIFAIGFLIWNLDNIFCSTITKWKQAVGWPAAFFLEGHSWWHVFTALGTYLMVVGNTFLTLRIKGHDSQTEYGLPTVFGLPRIQRLVRQKSG